MATYVVLTQWTEQGVKNVKDTVKRAEAAAQLAEKLGGSMTNIMWTQGAYDMVVTTEFPDDTGIMAFAAALGMLGNIRTQTMRAFTAQEVQAILDKLP